MASAAPATPIELLAGPLYIGILLSFLLFGILLVQFYIYSRAFRADNVWIRYTVFVIVLLDTAITIIGAALGWVTMVTKWGDLSAFAPFHWTLAPLPLLSSIIALMAQSFYAWRIYKLHNSRITPVIVLLIGSLACGMGGYCGIEGRIKGFSGNSTIKAEAIIWLGGSTFCDFLITCALVFSLFRHRSKTHFEETRSRMVNLITLTIETGMFTALTALLELLFFLIYPSTTMLFIGMFALSKMYSNCLLATLNSRNALHGHGGHRKNPLWVDVSSSALFSSHSRAAGGHSIGVGNGTGTVVVPQVHIATNVNVTRDGDVEMVAFEEDSRGSRLDGKHDHDVKYDV